MKKIGTLLDTHAWLWLIGDERGRANRKAWNEIEDASATNSLALSAISLWEVAQKAARGQLDLLQDPVVWLRDAANTPGLGVIEVDRETLTSSALLDMKHRDPADRILVATALRYGLRLATADRSLLEYAEKNRSLQVLDMRR